MIVSCGEALIDFIPLPGNELQYAPHPGGSPCNLAIAVARLGASAGFLGKISRDFFGDMIFDHLSHEGVDTSYTRRSDRLSTLAFVKVENGKEPRYAFYTEETADRHLISADIPEFLPDSVECLEFGSISLLLEPQGETIKKLIRRESGKRAISFDPNIRALLVTDKEKYIIEMEALAGLSSIVKASCADFEWLYPGRSAEKSALSWLSLGAGIVVLTRGKNGAILLSSSCRVETPEYPVNVKDTVGAGDTFHAALLVRLQEMGRLSARIGNELTREEALEVIQFAVKASSLNCARAGANPPGIAEMEEAP